MRFEVSLADDLVREIAERAREINERDPSSPFRNDKTDLDRLITVISTGVYFIRRKADTGYYV